MSFHLRFLQSILISFIAALSFESGDARAQRLSESQPAKDGIYAFVEFNPADLMWGRYRLAHENFLFESVSIAWLSELQENRRKNVFQERSLSAGLSLQYYPQSVTLQGPFVRGETAVAFSGLHEDAQARKPEMEGNQILLRVAGDLGWRVRLSERLTGSAAYGLRSTIPQVLWSQNSELSRRWIERGESLDVRVQINLGVLL